MISLSDLKSKIRAAQTEAVVNNNNNTDIASNINITDSASAVTAAVAATDTQGKFLIFFKRNMLSKNGFHHKKHYLFFNRRSI